MALRRLLYQTAEGYHDAAALTDETQLGKVTVTGVSGIGLDSQGSRVTGLPSPTAASDAATKQYVDDIASSIDWKQSVRYATDAALPAYTPAGSGVGKTLTANANGALSVDGFNPVATNRILVKNEGSGTHVDNGIYVVTDPGSGAAPFILTRATDFDTNAEVTGGASVWVNEGTANADSGWTLITNDPITVDTTALTFTQFSGLGQVTAGAGLTKTGNTLNVGDGPGILVSADKIEVELATNPGLEFDAGGDAGKLRWKPDTTRGLNRDASGAYIVLATSNPGVRFTIGGELDAKYNATGGVTSGASGLEIKIDDTPDTLDVDVDGLKVVGLPSLFKINGTAVGATVTAPNLDTLTNGSNADALHVHSIASVAEVSETWTAAGAVTKGEGVYISANNAVSTGDCTNDTKSRIIGVANQNIADTASGVIKIIGYVTGVLTSATAGTRYFMSSTGLPVLIGSLVGGDRTIQLGIAKNATDLFVQVFDYGKKAAP